MSQSHAEPVKSSAAPDSGTDSFANGLLNGLKAFLPGLSSRKPADEWVEILPYGFVSRNYLSYSAGRLSDCRVSLVSDGTKIFKLADGSFIIEAASGHVVEMDKSRRVVLVKVKKSEAEEARQAFKKCDLEDCYKVTVTFEGRSVIQMPGDIVINQDGNQVSVTMPNGSEIFAKAAN